MKKITLPLILSGFCLMLSACSQVPVTSTTSPISSTTTQNLPGSDRDAHGCIPSAGYQWCSYTQQCERPWILAKAHNIPNTEQSIQTYCNQK